MIGQHTIIAILKYHEANPIASNHDTIPTIPHTTSTINNCGTCLDNSTQVS